MKVKVCGMREPENIRQVAALQPDFMGFIFYSESKRFVGDDSTPELLASLPASIRKIGVFVNEEPEVIKETVALYNLDLVQLHGKETPRQCQELQEANIKVIKAFLWEMAFRFWPRCLMSATATIFCLTPGASSTAATALCLTGNCSKVI